MLAAFIPTRGPGLLASPSFARLAGSIDMLQEIEGRGMNNGKGGEERDVDWGEVSVNDGETDGL